MAPLLELTHITVRFPGGIVANKNVDLTIEEGEIHALLGENGAGKSTLMKVAFGMQAPTEGSLRWKGKPIHFRSAADAMAAGIGMVHQHFMLVSSFQVWENIILGHEPTQRGQIDKESALTQIHKLSEEYGLKVDPHAYVSDLSVGEQQRVEILKTLYRDIDLLILDEPTAVLTPQETDALFATLRTLVETGLTIIFISHKLREIKAIADRITVLRKGQKVASGYTKDYTIEEMATEMVGRPPAPPERIREPLSQDIALALRDLHVLDNRGLPAVKGLSLDLHKGEVLGIAGVEGNGQTELLEALTGLRPVQKGGLFAGQEELTHLSVQQRFAKGIAHVPQDRQHQGLVMSMQIRENLLLGRHHEEAFLRHGLWLDQEALDESGQKQVKAFDIQPPILTQHVNALSGGNQQKVVIARECSRPAELYLIAHPTRGVDIGAIEAIHAHLIQLQKEGASILLMSSELPELLALCDRIAVLYEGEIAGILPAEGTTEAALGVLMTGGSPMD